MIVESTSLDAAIRESVGSNCLVLEADVPIVRTVSWQFCEAHSLYPLLNLVGVGKTGNPHEPFGQPLGLLPFPSYVVPASHLPTLWLAFDWISRTMDSA